MVDCNMPIFDRGFEEYEVVELIAQDMKEMAAIPGRNFTVEDLLKRLHSGSKCYGLKHNGTLAAFTWCNFRMCDFVGAQFSLKHDEAYLYDAFTLLSFRGKKLAPYIRYQVYKEVGKLNKNALYSISDCNNKQSIRFKQKLNAKICGQWMYCDVFRKWKFSTFPADFRR